MMSKGNERMTYSLQCRNDTQGKVNYGIPSTRDVEGVNNRELVHLNRVVPSSPLQPEQLVAEVFSNLRRKKEPKLLHNLRPQREEQLKLVFG